MKYLPNVARSAAALTTLTVGAGYISSSYIAILTEDLRGFPHFLKKEHGKISLATTISSQNLPIHKTRRTTTGC
jgi:hypothetical protein